MSIPPITYEKYQKKFHLYVKREWADLEDSIRYPDMLFNDNRCSILKNNGRVKSAKVILQNGIPVFIKCYSHNSAPLILKYSLGLSRSQKLWKNSCGLVTRGLPIPSPIAYIEEKDWCHVKCSYIILEFLKDAIPFIEFFHKGISNVSKEKIRLMENLGRQIGKMHDYGCFHSDLHEGNILVKKISDHHKFFFIDLEGAKVRKKLTFKERVKDVSRFYYSMSANRISPEVNESFLKSYCRETRISLEENRFFSAVQTRTKKIEEKHRMNLSKAAG